MMNQRSWIVCVCVVAATTLQSNGAVAAAGADARSENLVPLPAQLEQQQQQRRELWSIWNLLPTHVLICDGPLGKHNRDNGRCTPSDNGFDSNSDFTTYTEVESGNSVYVQNSVAYNTDGSVAENFDPDQYEERGTGENAAIGGTVGSFNVWFLATIVSALGAFAAIAVGQRKGSNAGRHVLGGAIAKRNTRVTTLANEAFAPDKEKRLMEMSSFEVEPGTVTEMSASGEIETKTGFRIV